MKIRGVAAVALVILLPFVKVLPAQAPQPAQPSRELKLALAEGWSLASVGTVADSGDVISSPHYQTKGWYSATVPTTVFAALVKNKVFPDPDVGMNLRQVKGMTYPIGANFSNLRMEADSPYAVPWWYRKEFTLPASFKGKTIWLNFQGINYRANIWLNGQKIADLNEVAGAWRTYEFNVTKAAHITAENVLAVEVFAPSETDLAITFVDWNPAPPDKNMGLWREVYVTSSGPVALRYPAVISHLNSPANDKAELTVASQLKNSTPQPIRGTLKGEIENIEFSQEVELGPGETKDVIFDPAQVSQLNLANPRLWWPRQMGTPNLYRLHMEFDVNGKVSDRADCDFGIREVSSEVVPPNQRVFTVNGKRILIRGGGWSPDMMLRENSVRLEDEFRYVEDMGLNTIRLEGKLETPQFFDLADKRGILIMAGWCCCDHWEHWSKWSEADYKIAQESLRSQISRLRSHPSLIMWLNGSDNPPPPDVEQIYLTVEKDLLWPNPVVSSATAKPTSLTGVSGVKMTGPYEYVAPSYWLVDSPNHPSAKPCNPGGCGGAYGFNTETSMGPAVPPIESIERMVGKDHLWPIDDTWNYHAGGGTFKNLEVFTEALSNRYGKADSAEDYAFKSQLMTYEGVRAMYEAYSRDKYTSTGVIQWMLNNAWPSMIWHLYDYYLRPAGGYFGTKKATEPLHPLYGYDDHSIWVVSSQYQDAKALKLTVKLYNLDMSEKFSKEATLDASADSTQKVFALPDIADLSPTYFLRLALTDATGKVVGSNFYWLSTRQETLAWEKSTWWMTPTAVFADYTALSQLNKVSLKLSSRSERQGETEITHVTLENPSKSLAFFTRLKVTKGKGGEEILPVIWQDNYVTLLPGEKREITATYRARDLATAKPDVEVKGWNVE